MPRILTALLLACLMPLVPAVAQTWPNSGGLSSDAMRGTLQSFDRFNQYPAQRTLGDDRRERITGILGEAQEWVQERSRYVGDTDREAQRYFDRRRQWDRDWQTTPFRN